MTEAPVAARTARPGGAPPRDTPRRIADVLETLRTQRHLWLATARDGLPHLVPLGYCWDGSRLYCATKPGNRSVSNLRDSGTAKVAIGTAQDVVLVDATVTVRDPDSAPPELVALFDRLPLNPARVPGVVLLELSPRRISAWRNLAELSDRVVMEHGSWLAADPPEGADRGPHEGPGRGPRQSADRDPRDGADRDPHEGKEQHAGA